MRIGIWSSYVAKVGWRNSFAQQRLISMDELIRHYTQNKVRDGSCSLLFDKLSGNGVLVDFFELHDFYALRVITLREARVDGDCSYIFLSIAWLNIILISLRTLS